MKIGKLWLIAAILGILTIAGCQKTESPPPQPISPDARLVCLFFDDGWQNQYDVALPILLQHDFKATFGIITGSIDTGEDIWEYMGKKEIEKLAEYGMDIAGHTKTHPHLPAILSNEQLHEEIIGSKKQLEKLGIEVRTFIYPYCEWDDRVIGVVKEAGFTCARSCGWGEKPYDPRITDADAQYHIYSDPIINQDFDQFKAIVDQASRYSVVCLTYHFISDKGPEETSTPVANFCAQMRYLKESDFTVVLLPNLIK